ncbi:TIR domain-containing protein [Flammeovirga agarivorans]|uniref:Tetratricopeptide repeat protein n=1 Tax=Flammeovirga agarivorans TaxID=2726742 RepID=A0A7X8SK30_9BACT|nr:TIR domain-containing protein [Flammeovirga agarivorans]NLR91676.1 tetratricopeptide repeat protein [Flammeovirga agarivorans]
MKPKIFIGSSVEGLSVAYAIQQNLIHSAEVTVWDQGVFELSSTTIESLEEALDKSDYGIFIFSPDDVTKIRKDEFSVVRDNVILEYGLFVGKLGRERVFFVKPMNQDLHLPTDLLGITPGNYENDRDDKSLQAGTGAFCNQVRQKISKLGKRKETEEEGKSSEKEDSNTPKDNEWFHDFDSKKFSAAKTKLENLLKEQTDEIKIIEHRAWIAYCIFKENENKGIEELDKIIIDYSENEHSFMAVCKILYREDYNDKSIKLAEKAITKFPNSTKLKLLKADCINNSSSPEESIEYLKSINNGNDIDIALTLVNSYMDEKDFIEARSIVHSIYQEYPNNRLIKYKYSRIAYELGENEIALFLLESLTTEYPENSTYWGYLSNVCVSLDYYDLALTAKRRAQKITESKEEWIVSNIGNMFKNKGFYTESIEYFEKALTINSESEFAHDRMATAIKLRQSEKEEIEKSIKLGRKEIRNYKPDTVVES